MEEISELEGHWKHMDQFTQELTQGDYGHV